MKRHELTLKDSDYLYIKDECMLMRGSGNFDIIETINGAEAMTNMKQFTHNSNRGS